MRKYWKMHTPGFWELESTMVFQDKEYPSRGLGCQLHHRAWLTRLHIHSGSWMRDDCISEAWQVSPNVVVGLGWSLDRMKLQLQELGDEPWPHLHSQCPLCGLHI